MKSCFALVTAIALLLLSGNCNGDTFVVTSNADSGPGTLREALQNAASNGTSVPDLISFNIAYTTVSSITIGILSTLPVITSNVTIDGTTQPSPKLGVSDSRIIIEPLGENNYITMIDNCLAVKDADNVQIFGLCIKYFSDFAMDGNLHEPIAITLNNANNFVFGSPGKGNVIAGCCYGIGKFYFTGGADNCKIQSNIFGLDVDGKSSIAFRPFNNIGGIELTQVNNAAIGGNTVEQGNVFSGNAFGLAFIEVAGTINIGFNKFNTDYTGNVETNVSGSFGGRDSPATFFIYDNTISGESDFTAMSGRFLVTRNFFGTNSTRTAQFSDGILDFKNCTGEALVGGNNAADMNVFGYGVLGVGNDNSSKITVLHNSFYCHESGGIYMNWYTLPNKPFVTINKVSASSVEGTSRPNAIIELYYTDTCRFCEGKVFIDRFTADGAGKWKYAGATTGNVTATATNTDDSTTSAFAKPETDLSNAVIRNATCNKANGSITGIKVISGTDFYWTDDKGNVVGTDTTLVNIKAGTYQLVAGIGTNTCKESSQTFTIENTLPPSIDTTSFDVTEPSCGRFNGSVSYKDYLSPSDSAYWLNATGEITQRGTLFPNAAQGKYYFRIASGGDTSCYSSFGPITLVNQSGPSLVTDQVQNGSATCKKNNGFIKNITYRDATGNVYISWEDSTGKVIGNSIDLTDIAAGKYRLLFKDGSGCDTIVTPYFIVKDAGTILYDTSNMIVKESSCKGTDGAITGITLTNATLFTWVNTASGSIAGNNKDLTGIPPGSYQLKLNNPFGCELITDAIVVGQADFLTETVIDAAISNASCDMNNGAVMITGFSTDTSFYSFDWRDSMTNTIVSTSSSLQNLSPGFYVLHATDNNGCTQRIFVAGIQQTGKPVFDTHALQIVDDTCNSGKGAIHNLSMQDPLRTYAWTWHNSLQQEVTGKPNNLTSVNNGDYYAVVTDQYNCTVTSDIFHVDNIEKLPGPPQVNDLYIPRNTSATITVISPQEGSYDLLDNNLPGTLPLASSQTGSFETPVIGADRSFYIRHVYGDCAGALSKVTITVFDSTIIYVPNAFTPNNDGINDELHVSVQGRISAFSISIYNRWGGLVYSGNNINSYWDGNMHGKPLPSGAFVYILTARDYNNKYIKKTGTIALLR